MSQSLKSKYVELVMYLKRIYYRMASTNGQINGKYRAVQPVVIKGKGQVVFGQNVQFGVVNSPMFYNTYAYIEARTENSSISFGHNVSINNQFTVVSELGVAIHDDVLIGLNCAIYDSNFHDLDQTNRKNTDPNPEKVIIERNVFIGNNVTILKGVTIGENSVVAAGAMVLQSFPANVVIGGSPAKILKDLT
ncbi:acyltransferase [Gelidibacter japonicus]|uniref:acyltransferase n=1 Tax=Gelidibacter japonicus TaxID=1962232 RepID=UPI0013D103FC|nr:acyltransferase [Gelidibacter japonicus]